MGQYAFHGEMVFGGVAILVIAAVNEFLFRKVPDIQPYRAALKRFHYVSLCGLLLIAIGVFLYGYNESRFSLYAICAGAGCRVFSGFIIRRSKQRDG